MRAAIYRRFGGPITIEEVTDPTPPPDGVVIEVRASGVCRSDVSGWEGSDPDIILPHVPGHELAGVVIAVGTDVRRFSGGERVTVPFSLGCGACETCAGGNDQDCDNQQQPGFTGWGSFAELVAIPHADRNLVLLPDDTSFTTAALLGCRFGTAYRAVVERARVTAGRWVAVHGAGGLGLSAVMIAHAVDARVVAVDIDPAARSMAESLGAEATIDASATDDVAAVVREITGGGAHVSLDCLGSPVVAAASVASLRKLGRHIQVGLLNKGPTPLPMNLVVGRELEIMGSHGIAAHSYPAMLELITSGRVDPARILTATIPLDDLPGAFEEMQRFTGTGVTVVDRF